MVATRTLRALVAPILLTALALAPQPLVMAQSGYDTQGDAGFQAYLQVLAARARAQGVRQATIDSMIAGLTPNPTVIALDRAQPEMNPTARPPDFTPYRLAHVDAARINAGRAMFREVAGLHAAYRTHLWRAGLDPAVDLGQ